MVKRISNEIKSILTLSNQGETVFRCFAWENPDKFIVAKEYTKCYLTRLATKKIPGIYIPNEQTKRDGIFIHQGEGPESSEGCICVSKTDMEMLMTFINHNENNITIQIYEADPDLSRGGE